MTPVQCGRNISGQFRAPDASRPSPRLERMIRLGLAEQRFAGLPDGARPPTASSK